MLKTLLALSVLTFTFLSCEKDEIAIESSSKMMNSAFFGQLIILIVFIPILALQGVEGKMFKPMALTFMFAMIGVMILCLTYVPMMSAWFLRVPKTNKLSWGDKFIQRTEILYEKNLTKALGKAKWIFGKTVRTTRPLYFNWDCASKLHVWNWWWRKTRKRFKSRRCAHVQFGAQRFYFRQKTTPLLSYSIWWHSVY